jgi:hypothetical protein
VVNVNDVADSILSTIRVPKLEYFETSNSYDWATATLVHLNTGVQLTPVAPIDGVLISGAGEAAPILTALTNTMNASKLVAMVRFTLITL